MSEVLSEIAYYFLQIGWLGVLDIALVAITIYIVLALLRGTRALTLLRGIILLAIVITVLTRFLQLPGFSWLLAQSFPAILISIPVIFAPEIRRGLERLGRAGTNLQWNARAADPQPVIQAIATAAQRLSERQHGALIVIERQTGLKEYADTGVRLDAAVTPEALLQVFYPNTPLHDGAVILKEDRIVAAACVMPLTSVGIATDRQMGLRHRAALGITEVSDAVAVVVSEETGIVSVVHNGRMIRRLEQERLMHVLNAFYRPRGERSGWSWLIGLLGMERAPRGEPRPSRNNEAIGD
ncbi:MAG: diadenylate cyclase CdaA [Anaerolineales bacterium]